MKFKSKRTPEEIRAWKAEMRLLVKRVKNMDEAEKRRMIGTVITPEGHALSLNNSVLLYLQAGGRQIIQAGGFKQWQKAGRKVKKGEHAIGSIYVPITVKTRPTDSDDLPDDAPASTLKFRLVPVFDIDQTEDITGSTSEHVTTPQETPTEAPEQKKQPKPRIETPSLF